MKDLVVIEETATGFSAYSPDIEGCVATGRTVKEVQRAMSEAIEFHLDGAAAGKNGRAAASDAVHVSAGRITIQKRRTSRWRRPR